MISKKFSPQNANALFDRMVDLIACTAPLAALEQDFSLLLTSLAYGERLSLLALAPTEPCSSPSFLILTPMVILSARLKRCALSLFATVTAKLSPLPCAMAYEGTPPTAFTLRRNASPSVS